MTHKLSRVSPEAAAQIWPKIEGFIAGALRRSHSLSLSLPTDILAHVLFGRMQLWVAHDEAKIDAAIVTRVIPWDRSRTLYVPIVGGRNLKAWLEPAMDELERYGKSEGCRDIRGEFRQGWARVAGFKVTGVTLQRDID